jgi:hypothetical protein
MHKVAWLQHVSVSHEKAEQSDCAEVTVFIPAVLFILLHLSFDVAVG